MSINWNFRPKTQDEDIYNEVYTRNCYRLPDDMSGITVIDVGANIGCFTIACLDRGAGYVFAFEPDRDNYDALKAHILSHPRAGSVSLYNVSVSKFAGFSRVEAYQKRGDIEFTGGVSIFSQSGRIVESVSALEVIGTAFGRIWLKLDCEGAEYQILSSDLPWDRIERIFGECHDYRDGKFSRDTNPVEVMPDAFGGLEPNRNALFSRLWNVGYNNIKIEYNQEDDRLALFFASREEVYGEYNSLVSKQEILRESVAVLTPFRDARRYLRLYFEQISSLKSVLEAENMHLRLVAAEGDSTDGTRERIVELAAEYNVPLEVVDTTHGHMRWGSVEDPIRMKVMSDVMNKALDAVKESDDIVVWIMSDLEWDTATIFEMVRNIADFTANKKNVFAPMVFSDREKLIFYDTWAFRMSGYRFYSNSPWHHDMVGTDTRGMWKLDSAGTCLVMPAEIARRTRATNEEAVSFCQNAKESGYNIVLDANKSVFHAPAQGHRLLWVGDAVCVSGFARVTHNILPILSEAGYEIDVIATNFQGTPHNYPYRIWPAGEDSGAYLTQRLLRFAFEQGKQYDAIIVLDDPWNVPRITAALEGLRESGRVDSKVDNLPPVIAWVTVDGKNIQPLNSTDLYHIAASTEFGADEILTRGLENEFTSDVSVIPFGVNTQIYYPLDKLESRKLVSSAEIPEDAFIVGTVSTNQLRKRLDLVLKYFAEWITRYGIENAYLYLCLGAASYTGCDVVSLVRYYGLRKKVILNTSLLNEQAMAHVYSAFDVFISLSQGEGFGLCALEAMACGVPCVLSDWSGYSSWVPDDCAVKVACSSTALSSPLNSQAYVIGGVSDRQETINALHRLYTFPTMREKLQEKGLSLARQMSWKESGNKLLNVIDKVIAQNISGRCQQQHQQQQQQTKEIKSA